MDANREALLDTSKSKTARQDKALLDLYEMLTKRNEPAPGAFSGLSESERREYFRLSRRRSRARVRAADIDGAHEPTTGNVSDALADAALMILATGAPGVDQVRLVLGAVFARRPGVPMTVEQRARAGKLRPKLAVRNRS